MAMRTLFYKIILLCFCVSHVPLQAGWTPPVAVSAIAPGRTEAKVAVHRFGTATPGWTESDGSNIVVRASTRPPGGVWQAVPDTLSLSGEDANSPQIAIDINGNATAVWVRFDGSDFVIQASTRPFGGSWQAVPD